jgi:hemerythrin-like domain-containing protein
MRLAIEQSMIERAKKYASGKGRSLSDIIENYLKIITKEVQKEEVELIPIAKSLQGAFKEPRDFDNKTELSKSLADKHLKKIWQEVKQNQENR